jgi:CheY-like chemotaxis protein
MSNKVCSILLVDDDDVDVMSVRRAFQKLNVTNPLHVAKNGLEALTMLRSETLARPIIILLDLNMPKMGGLEFLDELRNDPALQALTVVVLTTSNEEGDKLHAFNKNVAGYIIKPVTPASFVEAMATLNKYWTLSEII